VGSASSETTTADLISSVQLHVFFRDFLLTTIPDDSFDGDRFMQSCPFSSCTRQVLSVSLIEVVCDAYVPVIPLQFENIDEGAE